MFRHLKGDEHATEIGCCLDCGSFLGPAAYLADVASGTINLVEVNPGVQATRVYITNATTMCTGSATNFAYLAATDANYNTMVASLLGAKFVGSLVDVYSSVDSTGFCHIYDLVVH